MKTLRGYLLILGIVIIFTACLKKGVEKGAGQNPNASYAGKWRIVSDSTNTQFWGLWGGLPDVGSKYTGTPADYYNFLPDGTLYTAENNYLDTGMYQQMKHDTLGLKYPRWGDPIRYIVSDHTVHTMTLTSAFPMVSPETASIHIIKLQK